jgi:diguanylate cyclase (GGDEF)-like protein
MLALPLIANEEPLGAALISFHARHSFNAREIAMGEQAAGQIALAVYKVRLLEELQRQAIVDELTGVYNYRGLRELGKREVERAQRFERPLSALFFDIDHFRAFNNRYSHAVGNLVLRSVAQQALANVRSVDFVSRFGGEEFVVLIPETELAAAVKIAERLRTSVAETQVETKYGPLSVTISLGVAELTADVPDLDALLDNANRAEHQAKEQGRNRVVGYGWYPHKPKHEDPQI